MKKKFIYNFKQNIELIRIFFILHIFILAIIYLFIYFITLALYYTLNFIFGWFS